MKIYTDVITSRKNEKIVASSLSSAKVRREERKFLIEGTKLLGEAISSGINIYEVYIRQSNKDDMIGFISSVESNESKKNHMNFQIYIVGDSCFEKISTESAPQGIAAVASFLDGFSQSMKVSEVAPDEKILMLHSIRDPGNMGTIIRSAVAFGVDRLIISDDCADIYNGKTVRASMGSLFKVKISSVSDFAASIHEIILSGRRVFAAELREGAISLCDLDIRTSDCMIIGNEGHGIPTQISAACSGSVYIPVSDWVESLNAATAASIFLWEMYAKFKE